MMAPVHLRVFLLYFVEIITLLVVETKRCYHSHPDRIDNGPSSFPDMIEAEMFAFLVITIQMTQCIWDKLTDHQAMTNQFHTRFYSSSMKQDRYLHILCFPHFTDNKNEPDMMDKNSDRLWKMQNLVEILNKIFSKFYSPSEYLAIDKVIILFKRRVIFQQSTPKKQKHFGIKIYKLCDENGHMHDMTVYSFLDRSVEISYGDSRFILMNDILETIVQISRQE